MYAQVEKPKENKSRAVANSVAQKKNDVKQGVGFVDNRTNNISTFHFARPATQVRQLKNAHALFTMPPVVRMNSDIRLANGTFKGHAYQIQLPGRAANKGDAIKAIASYIATAAIDGGGTGNFMKMKNVFRIANLPGKTNGGIDRDGYDLSNCVGSDNGEMAKFEPYVVVVNCFYASIQGNKRITMRYNFSAESYGYVTAIVDEEVFSEMVPGGLGRTATPYADYLASAPGVHKMDQDHLLNAFDQNHEKTGAQNLMGIIGQSPKNQNDLTDANALARHREHFDSIAKLAGEGPRFQCVLNNMDVLSSSTRFIATYPAPLGGFIAITFEDLASIWRNFNNAYNIPNATVAAELLRLYALKIAPGNTKRYPVDHIPAAGAGDIPI